MNKIVIILMLVSCVVGCAVKQSDQKLKDEVSKSLPLGATKIELRGNGWVTFEWDGRVFLYKQQQNQIGPAITEICGEKSENNVLTFEDLK